MRGIGSFGLAVLFAGSLLGTNTVTAAPLIDGKYYEDMAFADCGLSALFENPYWRKYPHHSGYMPCATDPIWQRLGESHLASLSRSKVPCWA